MQYNHITALISTYHGRRSQYQPLVSFPPPFTICPHLISILPFSYAEYLSDPLIFFL